MTAAIGIGTLPNWLILASMLAAAWYFRRGGGGAALDLLVTANNVLEKRVHELEKQRQLDAATIAELRGRTDITLALGPAFQPLFEWTEHHETRAQARSDATIAVLQAVADSFNELKEGRSA